MVSATSTSAKLGAPAEVLPKPAWAKIILISGLITALYWRVWVDMVGDWWTEPSLSQGFLIPPLALYMAWLNRRVTWEKPATSESHGLLVIGAACLGFLLGKLGAEFFLSRISFVLMLVGLTWVFWGRERLRTLAFPFLLLATMIPLPVIVYNQMATPLQLFASEMATNLSQAAGISIYRDGNIIHLAHISLGVEEACSGLNSLSALMVAALLLGFLQCTRVRTRVILFAVALPLSIAVNVVRVTGTAILADYHEEFAMGFYHSFSGWLVFVGGFGVLYLIAGILHRFGD
jgi:exosortase